MKELNAIVEYESARRQIKTDSNRISDFMHCKCSTSHTTGIGESCLEKLFQHNTNARIADEVGESLDGGMGEAPVLCNRCYLLHEAIQNRKKSKQRFGAAKRALSTIARFYLKGEKCKQSAN